MQQQPSLSQRACQLQVANEAGVSLPYLKQQLQGEKVMRAQLQKARQSPKGLSLSEAHLPQF